MLETHCSLPEQATISAPLLASLFREFASASHDVEGFFLGEARLNVTRQVNGDTGHTTEDANWSIGIHSFHVWSPLFPPLLHTNGDLNDDALAKYGVTDQAIIGYFHYRRNAPHRPSLRDRAVHQELCRFFQQPSPTAQLSPKSPFLLGLFTATTATPHIPQLPSTDEAVAANLSLMDLSPESAPPPLMYTKGDNQPIQDCHWSVWYTDLHHDSKLCLLPLRIANLVQSQPPVAASLSALVSTGLAGDTLSQVTAALHAAQGDATVTHHEQMCHALIDMIRHVATDLVHEEAKLQNARQRHQPPLPLTVKQQLGSIASETLLLPLKPQAGPQFALDEMDKDTEDLLLEMTE
ncbi:hypothetical protein H4R35_004935 [Dimargaris xerosporica]|nr:hypothetical protein H4R35_004935 [Dimargaris xerosporica]